MGVINSILSWWMKKRMHQIELFVKYPIDVQQDVFMNLIDNAAQTEFGKHYDFQSITSIEEFANRIPVQTYEQLYPWIERSMLGETNLLWPTSVKWFAKSSGTTNAKSKYIPITEESLDQCHFKAGKDMLSVYCLANPDTNIFDGKCLTMGGSYQPNSLNTSSYLGDLSAVVMQNLPFWAEIHRTPDLEVALLDKWEEKIDRIVEQTMHQNVTSLAGVPTWTLLVLQRLLEKTGKKTVNEVWPNLEVYFHGGINFKPYHEEFKSILNLPNMHFFESYNASEGFFGVQDQIHSKEMLLMLDYGIYYEFIPRSEMHLDTPKTITLAQVKTDEIYAMVISTNGGLWRYLIGDTIKFTSTEPYRFIIIGRTKHYINAFGEELMINNADFALEAACLVTGATIRDYTAAPVFLTTNSKGCHEWAIEFITPPSCLTVFSEILDAKLKEVNSDYEAKRQNNLALTLPIVKSLPTGVFYQWLKKRDKLGGQHKIPRLANDRKFIEEILALSKELPLT